MPKLAKEKDESKKVSEPQPMAEVATDGVVGKRIGIKLTENNLIDFESLRANTKKAFVEAIQKTAASPEGLAALGLKSEQVAQVFPDEWCEQIFEKVGELIEKPLFKRMLKLDDEVADIFKYTPEERKLLAHPTAVVLSKWMPATGAKWKDEIFLFVVLAGLHRQKIEDAKKMQAERDEKKSPQSVVVKSVPGAVTAPPQQKQKA